MLDPVTFNVIVTGLVGTYKAYTEYKAAAVKAEAEHAPIPAKSDEAVKGEQVAPLIKAAVQQHGDDKDQNALVQFEVDPDDYRSVFETKIVRLAERNPSFAQQLQTLAQNADVQGSGVQGNVNVSGEGKIYGTAVGVNEGDITGTYTFSEDGQKKK